MVPLLGQLLDSSIGLDSDLFDNLGALWSNTLLPNPSKKNRNAIDAKTCSSRADSKQACSIITIEFAGFVVSYAEAFVLKAWLAHTDHLVESSGFGCSLVFYLFLAAWEIV